MKIIGKIILAIKNIFIKQNKLKKIEESKLMIERNDKENFISSLQIKTKEKKENKKVEMSTTCNGNGLGIQGDITY